MSSRSNLDDLASSSKPKPPAAQTTTPPPFVVAIIILLVIMFLGALLLWNMASTKVSQNEILKSGLATAEAQAEATPTCAEWKSSVEQVSTFLQTGKFKTAADLASATLEGDVELSCVEIANSLKALWYDARMDDLIGGQVPEWYDHRVDQNSVALWHDIETTADRYGVPAHKRWPSAMIFDRAYSVQLWALADAAYMQASVNGNELVAPSQKRYALLRNWGHDLAEAPDPASRELASRLLATAVMISDRYNLRDESACQDLERQFTFANCRDAEPDLGEPLLANTSTTP